MSTTPTQESEADNSSSVQSPSSVLAEQGTGTSARTAGTADDLETSSIEALDWSEADEEELQEQERARAAEERAKGLYKGFSKRKSPQESVVESVTISEDGTVKGTMLSSSLLQSISASMEDENSKKSVIENWASDVTNAVQRGEIEVENESSSNEVETEEKQEGDGKSSSTGKNLRKRKNAAMSKSASTVSSCAADSTSDPLSNAPVLDDGPIWNKGPKRYRFEENRRVNQKLTFAVAFAVVLALGLGLGNLVAYNECESEFKASQQMSYKSEHQEVKSNLDENMMNSNQMVYESRYQEDDSNEFEKVKAEVKPEANPSYSEDRRHNLENEEHIKDDLKNDKYADHIETLTKIVKTLDNLQQKLDNFENKSRQLISGGVVMLKEPESDDFASSSDSSIDLDEAGAKVESSTPTSEENEKIDVMEEEFQDEFVLNLIEGIEETAYYLKQQENKNRLEQLDMLRSGPELSANQNEEGIDNSDALTVKAYLQAFVQAQDEFIRREREELRERKILGLAEERDPTEYSAEERMEIKQKYDEFMSEYPVREEAEIIRERLKFKEPDVSYTWDSGTNDDDSLSDQMSYETETDENSEDFSNSENINQDDYINTGKRKKYEKNENKWHRQKRDKKEERKYKDKNKRYKVPKDSFKDNQNQWRDVDYDDDDDDHKRKKNSQKSVDGHQYYKQNKQVDANWMYERNKVRENNRHEFGGKVKSQQNHHSSTGPKARNWQIERDRAREKSRNKHFRSKFQDD